MDVDVSNKQISYAINKLVFNHSTRFVGVLSVFCSGDFAHLVDDLQNLGFYIHKRYSFVYLI